MITHIFCVGKVDGNRDIVIRPQYAPASEDAGMDIAPLPLEEWREIGGYPNYRISNMGRVASNYVRGERRSAGTFQSATGKWHLLKGLVMKTGYASVCLSHQGQIKRMSVHVLVLEAFVGPRPPGFVGCHYNGLRDDNRLANLRWDTEKANADDQLRHGTRPIGEQKTQAKLSDNQAREIIMMLHSGTVSLSEIARKFGVDASTVKSIEDGKSWNHIERPSPMRKGKRISGLSGIDNPAAKLSEVDVVEIRRQLIEGESLISIARYFGVSHATISRIKTGQAWKTATGSLRPLQDTIDEAADAQEAQDARDDIEFWRHGC